MKIFLSPLNGVGCFQTHTLRGRNIKCGLSPIFYFMLFYVCGYSFNDPVNLLDVNGLAPFTNNSDVPIPYKHEDNRIKQALIKGARLELKSASVGWVNCRVGRASLHPPFFLYDIKSMSCITAMTDY
jgi:hypothetical protein